MLDYQIARQEIDGSWSVLEFRSPDDSAAIAHGISVRTSTRSELYQADRWLATFDAMSEAHDFGVLQGQRPAWIETEFAYFQRRAAEEREWARKSAVASARLAHFSMAEHFESLGRVIQAKERQRRFYDVNAALVRPSGAVTTVDDASEGRRLRY